MKFLIVDDHPIVRKGLGQVLRDAYPDPVIGEAKDTREAIERVMGENWDVVILDISMPGRSGLDALKEIRKMSPRLPVLVLSAHPEDHFATRVLRAGAAGYLTKGTATEELVTAINKVISGGKYISPSLAERLAEELNSDPLGGPPHERLSDREYEVLRLIATGKTVSEIALELSLSVKTISTYRARILDKVHMKSNAELTRYAIRHGLVE